MTSSSVFTRGEQISRFADYNRHIKKMSFKFGLSGVFTVKDDLLFVSDAKNTV